MSGKKILLLAGDYAEDYEIMVPYQALLLVGHTVHAVSPGRKSGESVRTAVHDFLPGEQTYTELRGHNFVLNYNFDDVKVTDYHGLVIPGGRAPEHLRLNPKVVEIVKHFLDTNKPIAALLIPCGIKGRKITAYFALEADIRAAGAEWVQVPVDGATADGNLVTGVAWPGHPAWLAKFLELLGTKIQP